MDPITHAVIGAAVAKIADAGSLTDPATIGALAGAVIPDMDILLQNWGDYVYLKNHRGASHSLAGLAALTAVTALVLKLVFPAADIWRLLMFTALGCLSHTAVDVFNSYGAQLLWPVKEKKYSLSLLTTFDPVFIVTLSGYYFVKGTLEYVFLGTFIAYFLLRLGMHFLARRTLCREFGDRCLKVSVFPSTAGFYRWHFVVECEDKNIIGVKSFFGGKIKILAELEKTREENIRVALRSPVGKFFKDFTPLFHVAVEKAGGITRYVFTDMRYYLRNHFLHHAVLEINNKNGAVLETFNPYSMNRPNIIP